MTFAGLELEHADHLTTTKGGPVRTKLDPALSITFKGFQTGACLLLRPWSVTCTVPRDATTAEESNTWSLPWQNSLLIMEASVKINSGYWSGEQ